MQAAKAAQAQNGMARRLGSTEAILSISTESRAYHSTSAQARVGIAVGKEGNAYFPIIGRSMFIDIGCFFALHVCSTHQARILVGQHEPEFDGPRLDNTGECQSEPPSNPGLDKL